MSSFVDGNALGGVFSEVFAVDLTGARGRCAGCGHVAAIGESRVYDRAAGSVARCSGCDAVLVRVVVAPGRIFLDMHGLSVLEIPLETPL
jgi:Family of unknown function (DUF6510)